METEESNLSFSSKFFGRSYETEQLRDAYCQLGDHPIAVLVGGYAGIGKTRLIQHVIDELRAKVGKGEARPFFFCSGKADELFSTDPFSSIVKAMTQLLKTLDPNEKTTLRRRILDAVGREGKVLTDLIPELEELIGKQPELQISSTSTSSLNRFTYLFQTMIRAIGSPEKPLVLSLDDLQWTDASSLDLVGSLLSDTDLSHFMFVGSYRDNEVDETHPLVRLLNRLRRQGMTYVTLSLGNLTPDETKAWTQDTLQLEEVDDLVDRMYGKTRGNIFYLKAALQQLEQKGILRYSLAGRTWEWDSLRLDHEGETSNNVVDLVLANLLNMSEELRCTMMVAAHFRSSFSVSLLHDLMKDCLQYEKDLSDLVVVLERGVTGGLLENNLGSDVYQFIHDRVRQASLLVAKEEGRHLELRIVVGRFLLSRSEPEEWMFFAGIDHLNSVPLDVLNENGYSTMEIAELNAQAGKKAAQLTAYSPASRYYRKCVDLVKEHEQDPWQTHYDLCLEVFSSCAEVQLCLGNFEVGSAHAYEIFTNASTPSDKLRAYTSLAESLGRRGHPIDALDILKKGLAILNETPRGVNVVQVLRKLQRIKTMYSKLSVDEIAGLPSLVDPVRVEAVETLTRTSIRSIWGGNKLLALWATLRTCEIAVTEGVCAASVSGISSFGAMLCSFAPPILDVEVGRRINVGARRLTTRIGATSMEARMFFNAASYVESWTAPLPASMRLFSQAYRSGMRSGDFEHAFLALSACNLYQFASGQRLDAILQETDHTMGLMKQYKIDSVAVLLKHHMRLLMDISGKSIDPLQWANEEDQPPSKKQKDFAVICQLVFRYVSRLQTAYYVGAFELAYRLGLYFEAVKDADTSFVTVTHGFFFRVLSCTAMYRKSPKRMYRTRAWRLLRQMKSRKTMNNEHRINILEAEACATFGVKKKQKLRDLFDTAISMASAGGFLQDAALANELAGEYYLSQGDRFWAKHYLTCAYTMYKAWEARAKTKQMLERHEGLIDTESMVADRLTNRGRNSNFSTRSVVLDQTIDSGRLPSVGYTCTL